MKILLTGVTGYLGKRLLPVLLSGGHEVICCVRDLSRFDATRYNGGKLSVIEVDFLKKDRLSSIPSDIDAAYYLIHSMSASIKDFDELEKQSAENFTEAINKTNAEQVIYLGGIANDENLSKHLTSRKKVEEILSEGNFNLTVLRAGIVIGSGSASFEIIRDLVEKLPVMITPRWLNTKCQPIAIRNVIQFLYGVLFKKETYGKIYDIGGPDILTYREILLKFASVRGLKRRILVLPVMTPRLSSYWLFFVTSTSYKLAVNLVNSMKVEVICAPNNLSDLLKINLISYEDSVRFAFEKIEHHDVPSSWKDALTKNSSTEKFSGLIEVPEFGCFKDERSIKIKDELAVVDRIWAIGGKNGWYYANWLWEIRGLLDQIIGGVGLRRGRRSDVDIQAGDSLDFWRVLYADKSEKRLLLYAEMKLPGEAWLEFKVVNNQLIQKAVFRPLGLMGRLYWYLVSPFHFFVFRGMIKNIAGT